MSEMTLSQITEFLAPRRHAILATLRKSGAPQLSPVWYLFEDGVLYISCMANSAKRHNIERDPRVTACIDGGPNDVRTVTISGEAVILPVEHPLQQAMRWKIVRKYHDSDDEARAYGDSAEIANNILLVIKPSKIISQDFS